MASDLAVIASGRLGVVGISLISILLITRMLGPAGYGTVALVTIVSTLVFTVSTSWTATSVRRYGREDLETRGTMNRLTWNRGLIVAPIAVISITAVLILKLIHALPGAIAWQLVWIALGIALVTILVDHWSCLLETSGKMRISAGGQVMTQAVFAGTLGILAVSGSRVSADAVLVLKLLTSALFVIVVAPAVWRIGLFPVAVDRQLLRRMLWLSVPLIGLIVSQYIFASVDVVILRMFRSQADVGVYAVAYQAYTMLSGAASSALPVLVPLFVSLQLAGRRNLIERYLGHGVPIGLFAMASLTGLIVPLVPVVAPVLLGHAFKAAAVPMVILMVGLLFLFAAYLAAPILTLHEQTRATAAVNAVAAVINVVGDLLMVGVFHMGIIAPALATSGALLFIAVAFYVRARHLLTMEVRPDLLLAAPLLAGLIPTLAVGGLAGAVIGVIGSLGTSAAILAWRTPFNAEDAVLIAKLQLPAVVKRVALKAAALAA